VAPWRWFPCKPKHVGAVLLILKCFNNSTFFNVVCISWILKCWILLMHGVTMKFKNQISRKSVQWLQSCSMPKKRLTNGQTLRHDEANRRSSQFCERTLKCDSLSETVGLTNTTLSFCSLVIVLFNQKPLRVSGDSPVGPGDNHYSITKCCYAVGRAFNSLFQRQKSLFFL